MEYIKLDVWIEARKLVKQVYSVTALFPKSEQFGLTSQIRRGVVSVPSNIAEGAGRRTSKDTLHFLFVSRGILYELETQLYLAYDLEYITQDSLELLLEQISTNKKLLNGFINYYKKLI
jgi:four helix bundle protein